MRGGGWGPFPHSKAQQTSLTLLEARSSKLEARSSKLDWNDSDRMLLRVRAAVVRLAMSTGYHAKANHRTRQTTAQGKPPYKANHRTRQTTILTTAQGKPPYKANHRTRLTTVQGKPTHSGRKP
jgi:hypothetical protein